MFDTVLDLVRFAALIWVSGDNHQANPGDGCDHVSGWPIANKGRSSARGGKVSSSTQFLTGLIFNRMKELLLIPLALFGLTTLASAQTWGYTTPRFGGGQNFYQHGNQGSSWGYTTPRFGGGFNYYQCGDHGSSWGYATPRFGGGYNFYGYGDDGE